MYIVVGTHYLSLIDLLDVTAVVVVVICGVLYWIVMQYYQYQHLPLIIAVPHLGVMLCYVIIAPRVSAGVVLLLDVVSQAVLYHVQCDRYACAIYKATRAAE